MAAEYTKHSQRLTGENQTLDWTKASSLSRQDHWKLLSVFGQQQRKQPGKVAPGAPAGPPPPGRGSEAIFQAQTILILSKEKKDRWKEEPRLVKIRNGVTLATRREKLLFGVEGIRQDKALAEREGSRGQDGGTDGGETEASGGREDMIQKRRKGELKSKRDREYFGLRHTSQQDPL